MDTFFQITLPVPSSPELLGPISTSPEYLWDSHFGVTSSIAASTLLSIHITMASLLRCLVLVSCSFLLVEALPWRNHETRATPSQACGDQLADIMSLVCSGRGYNGYSFSFRPERTNARRVRRQIVDECCRKSCTPTMLEMYCRPEPTEITTTVQIRKRSDSGVDSTEHQEEITIQNTTEARIQNSIRQENPTETKDSTTSTKKDSTIHKQLSLLRPLEHKTHRQNMIHPANQATPNDTTEEEFNKQSSIPLMRRHKSHHHSSRQFRAFAKAKREKSGESTQTFQIGTVKPYFVGRALVSYRSYPAHHAPAS